MSRSRYSPSSKQDLRSIADYYRDKNRDYAERTIKAIRDQCRRLARQPGMGRSRDDLAIGLRSFSVGSYIIFFQKSENGIDVVRVLHSAMQQTPDLFTEESE